MLYAFKFFGQREFSVFLKFCPMATTMKNSSWIQYHQYRFIHSKSFSIVLNRFIFIYSIGMSSIKCHRNIEIFFIIIIHPQKLDVLYSSWKIFIVFPSEKHIKLIFYLIRIATEFYKLNFCFVIKSIILIIFAFYHTRFCAHLIARYIV